MSERINIPFTNEHFAAFCEKMLGQPYWYGSCAYKATAALLNRKSRQYPSHYGSARTARYQQDIRSFLFSENVIYADACLCQLFRAELRAHQRKAEFAQLFCGRKICRRQLHAAERYPFHTVATHLAHPRNYFLNAAR